MLIARGVLGAILLFLGHELNFLFGGGMAALIAIRLTPLLPPQWPAWSDTAFILGMGVLGCGADPYQRTCRIFPLRLFGGRLFPRRILCSQRSLHPSFAFRGWGSHWRA